MAFRPVVFEMNVPELPSAPPDGKWSKIIGLFHKFPKFTPRNTKILTAVAAIIIALTMIAFVVFSVFANNKTLKKKYNLGINQQTQDAGPQEATKSKAALPGGGIATGVGGTTGTNSPAVTLTANPATAETGTTVTLKWSVTNSPKSCVASDDWSGTKSTTGEEQSPKLTAVQVYLFTITCKTDKGTGYSTVSVGATAPPSKSAPAVIGAPVVTFAASPTFIFTGDFSTLNWSATNSPTSCTASGDWSGVKIGTGSASTGVLNTVKTYSFILLCNNASGASQPKTAQVLVKAPPPNLPITSLSSNPTGPITPGSSAILTWSVTNNPTSCIASGDWSGAKPSSGTVNTGPLNSIRTYNYNLDCSNDAGSTNDKVALAVIPDPPQVSITASPTSILTGSSSTLSWSATNNPTLCTASGAWSGSKLATGSVSMGAINTKGTYTYQLKCDNAGGSQLRTATVIVTDPPIPVVSISTNPITTTTGNNSTISWSVTNNPSSCTASGDWSGAKSSTGTTSTVTLTVVKTYNFVLTCTNPGGSGSGTASVNVTAAGGGVVTPTVSISALPTSIGTGSASTLTWSSANNPTSCAASNAWSGAKSGSGSASTNTMNSAGTFTYTLSCTNSAGTGSASATVSVIAIPVVSVSLSPTSITTGSSATISWSATNSPSSCSAGGSWSGSKAASGSQTTGNINTAGTYTYSLTCTNAGGTASGSDTLTVSPPAVVYCGGLTPCYGPTDLAGRASPGNCWGWNVSWVINITSFRPSHPGGIQGGSSSTIENAGATCNHDIHAILAGSAVIPGFKDANGSTKHTHTSTTTNNGGGSTLQGYRVGYYDASKP